MIHGIYLSVIFILLVALRCAAWQSIARGEALNATSDTNVYFKRRLSELSRERTLLEEQNKVLADGMTQTLENYVETLDA